MPEVAAPVWAFHPVVGGVHVPRVGLLDPVVEVAVPVLLHGLLPARAGGGEVGDGHVVPVARLDESARGCAWYQEVTAVKSDVGVEEVEVLVDLYALFGLHHGPGVDAAVRLDAVVGLRRVGQVVLEAAVVGVSSWIVEKWWLVG